MTSIDFLNKVHKILDSQEYNLSYSPAMSKNYMLYCNGNFIGGLFDEELCFVYADSVSELLGQPEPVYRGYSSTAQHRMLVIPEEHWAKALKLLYTLRPSPRIICCTAMATSSVARSMRRCASSTPTV